MSDFPCDPLFEVCEDQNQSVYLDDEKYESIGEGTFALETYQMMYGGYNFAMLALSAYFYREYHTAIIDDTTRFPDYTEESGYTDHTREWALESSEINAWRNQIYALWAVNGLGFGLWAANQIFDNEGGLIHYLFFRMTQVYFLAPMLNALFAAAVVESYVPSRAEEEFDNIQDDL